MAGQHNTTSVTYGHPSYATSQDYGVSGVWWIRLEQRSLEEDGVSDKTTLAEAADLVDAVYELEPCADPGATGGGGQASEDPPISQEEFTSLAKSQLDIPTCEDLENGYREYVYVYRSQTRFPYELELSYGEIEKTETVTELFEEFIVFDNQYQVSLSKPIISPDGEAYENEDNIANLSGVTIEYLTEFFATDGELENPGLTLRGSTLNFDEPVTGSLKITYPTQYDIVTILMEEPQDVSLRAFYHGLVTDLIVEPKILDELDLDDCLEGFTRTKWKFLGDSKCWQQVYREYRCQCSGDVDHIDDDWVPVTCRDGDSNGTFYHDDDREYEYITCEGEEDQLNDPAFYEETCCTTVDPNRLPTCQEYKRVFIGGEEIVNGKDYWRAIYGPDTAFIALGPKYQFNCGDHTIRWEVNERSCCDWPSEIMGGGGGGLARNAETTVCVTDGTGLPPYSWGVDGGGNGLSISRKAQNNCVLVKTNDCFCTPGVVYAQDACDWYNISLFWPSDGSWGAVSVQQLGSAYKWHHDGDPFDNGKFYVHGFNADFTLHSIQSFGQASVTPVGTDGAPPTEQEIKDQICITSYEDYDGSSPAALPDNLDGYKACETGEQVWYKENPLTPGTYRAYYTRTGTRSTSEFTKSAVCEEELEYDDANSAVNVPDNDQVNVFWLYGIPPFELFVSGQEVYLDPARTVTSLQYVNVRGATIYSGDTCGGIEIYITDSCGNSVTGQLRAEDGSWHQDYTSSWGIYGSAYNNVPPREGGCPITFFHDRCGGYGSVYDYPKEHIAGKWKIRYRMEWDYSTGPGIYCLDNGATCYCCTGTCANNYTVGEWVAIRQAQCENLRALAANSCGCASVNHSSTPEKCMSGCSCVDYGYYLQPGQCDAWMMWDDWYPYECSYGQAAQYAPFMSSEPGFYSHSRLENAPCDGSCSSWLTWSYTMCNFVTIYEWKC